MHIYAFKLCSLTAMQSLLQVCPVRNDRVYTATICVCVYTRVPILKHKCGQNKNIPPFVSHLWCLVKLCSCSVFARLVFTDDYNTLKPPSTKKTYATFQMSSKSTWLPRSSRDAAAVPPYHLTIYVVFPLGRSLASPEPISGPCT